jgi:lipoprotein-releasing system ATP-binding protein
MNNACRIRVENLRKAFRRKDGALEVLKGVSFTLRQGEMLGLVGPSGAGKTTLLQIVGTLDRATEGAVLYDGQDITILPEGKLAAFRNRTIGFVFQSHHLLPEFNAKENVMLPCLIAGMGPAEAGHRAEGLIAEMGLGDRMIHRVGELSGGEQQRVAICRALAMEPTVLLADEPTGNLDKKTAGAVMDLLVELNRKRDLSVIMVTHNEDMAKRMHRLMKIDDGRIVS